MPASKDHEEWCRNQHAEMTKNIAKVYTRLGKMESLAEERGDCTKQVRKELQSINDWTKKRDGATHALMWVAGILGVVFGIGLTVYKLSS